MPLSKEKQVVLLTIKSEYPLAVNIKHFCEFFKDYGDEIISVKGLSNKRAQ
jgi:hypothetical protein